MARLPVPTVLLLALSLAVAGCRDDEGCPSGQTECNGVCRDAGYFQSAAGDCGACGVACGVGTCAGGVCQCEGGTACPGQNPRCADTQNDPAHCGGCGQACEKPGAGCAAGACACVAPADDDCGAFCTNTLTDARNCGLDAAAGCGNDCPLANQICSGGACACPASRPTVCGAACVNTATDPQHCGGCGNLCTGNRVCAGSQCVCPAPRILCGGVCVDVASDERNCGGCGTTCSAGKTCEAGTCACGGATPLTCGTTCCGGTECCGNGCPILHPNGLGGTYLDCGPLDEHTLAQAHRAAESWSPAGLTFTVAPQCPTDSCLCRQSATQAAVWCYSGSDAKGLVALFPSPNCPAAACPVRGVSGVSWR